MLGALQVTVTLLPLTSLVGATGASGEVGVVIDGNIASLEYPFELLARILKMYGVPAVSPVTTTDVSFPDGVMAALCVSVKEVEVIV